MTHDVAVLGSGAAAIGAGATLHRLGIDVVRLDTGPGPQSVGHPGTLGTVWGLFPGMEGFRVLAVGTEGGFELSARVLLVAEGAAPNPPAVPGWTLPGVILEGEFEIPEDRLGDHRRTVILGRGQGVLILAEHLRGRAQDVVRVALADPPFQHPNVVALRTAGVRVDFRRRPMRLLGERRVTGVALTRDDGADPEIVEAERVLLAFGVRSRPRLPRMLGCRLVFDAGRGGWIVDQSDHRTSMAGVFVTGCSAGLDDRGEVGEEAAAAVARALGHHRRGRAPMRPDAGRDPDVRLGLSTAGDLMAPARDDTLICPCAGVRLRDLEALAPLTSGDMGVLRRLSGVGMGACQGELCDGLVRTATARALAVDEASLGPPRVRPPATPIPLAAIAGLHS